MIRALEAARDVPTDAELEPVARAIMLLRTPEYADDALWAEHWKWFLAGRHDPNSCVHLSHQGIALRQARAAVQAWQAAHDAQRGTCRWTRKVDVWHSACGKKLWFEDDASPGENGHTYCHGCGKPIEVVADPLPPLPGEGE